MTGSAVAGRGAVTRVVGAAFMVGVLLALGGIGLSSAAASAGKTVVAVGAENEYANVIAQIGGRYVSVDARS